jgi:hypothetical protein
MSDSVVLPPTIGATISTPPKHEPLRYRVARGAAAIALVAAAGVVAADIIGPERLGKLWEWLTAAGPAPASAKPFATSQALNFFVNRPIAGSTLKVTTGVSFASVADLTAGKPHSYWCYVNAAETIGGVSHDISLGTQQGSAPPVFAQVTDLAPDQLGRFGLSAQQLVALAPSHCQFGRIDPLAGLSR